MHSDDRGRSGAEAPQAEQDLRSKTLKWLLEQDLSEPEETLFRVVEDGPGNGELTEREAAVAGRPMIGSAASADDLSAFVDEEIVLSGEPGNNIYRGSDSDSPRPGSGDRGAPGVVAIDHRRQNGAGSGDGQLVEDGFDILGLEDEDDIGAQPLALKRSRHDNTDTNATRAPNPAPEPQPASAGDAPGEYAGDGEDLSGVDSPGVDTLLEVAPPGPLEAAADTVPDEASESGLSLLGDDDGDWPGEEALDDLPGTLELSDSEGEDWLAMEPPSDSEGDDWPAAELAMDEPVIPDTSTVPASGIGGDPLEFDTTPAADPEMAEPVEPEAGPAVDLDLSVQMDSETAPEVDLALEGPADFDAAPGPDLELEDLAEPDTAPSLELAAEELSPEPFPELSPELSSPDLAGETETRDALVDGELEITVDPVPASVAEQAPAPEPADEPDAGDAGDDRDDGESDSVLGYVARYAPPSDDGEFDRYLLRGEHLLHSEYNFEDLSVERTEGVVSVDPSLESDPDFHSDIGLPREFNPRTLDALTRVLGPVMEYLSEAVEERLRELELESGSVVLDARFATDPVSAHQCEEEAYLPVTDIAPGLPPALLVLERAEREALCVRLVFGASGETCNDLFREDFVPAVDTAPAATVEAAPGLRPGVVADGVSIDFDLGGTLSDAFAVDSESANDEGPGDHTADPAPEMPGSPLSEDGSEAMSPPPDLGDAGETVAGELTEGELTEGEALDWPTGPTGSGEDPLPPDIFDELEEELQDGLDSEGDDWLAFGADNGNDHNNINDNNAPRAREEAEISEAAASQTPGAVESTGGDVFELIFSPDELEDADDLAGETAPAEEVDVEALFESLGGDEADIGDICGVALDEFGGGESPSGDSAPEADIAADGAEEPLMPATAEPGDGSGEALWCVPSNIRFNYTSASGSEVFSDFLDAFLEEGAVELEKLEDAIGQWEKDIDAPAGRDEVPRALHTLKGIAKGVGLQRYGTLIHNFETLLAGLARPAAGEEATYFSIVNAWLDAAVRGFEHIQGTETDVASELPRAEDLAQPVTSGDAAAAVDVHSEVHTDQRPVSSRERQRDKQLADEGAKVLAAQQTIRMTSEALDHLLNLSNQAQQLGVRSSQSTFKSKRAGAELLARLSSVRSHITKIADRALQNVTARGSMPSELDALEMDQYSELQEAANILREAIEDLDDLIHVASRQTASAESLLKQQASVITSLGTAIRDARVVPVSRLMPGLRRIVRTVGADLGKAVNFRVLGESGKLDRDSHVCCQIILEHMVRNALDHGIETPQARRAAGKPETGLVTIDVSKQGSDYVMRLSDDGRGMDPAALRETARRRGLDIDVSALSDRDALRLIFHRGFSTADRVSEISGRGVGMDIVLSELQKIGGDIDIESTPGAGTTFQIRVPSNVNVNGALLVSAGDVSYAIPLDGLVAVEHLPVDDFYRAITAGESLTVFDLECDPAYLATLCSGEKLPDPGSWGERTLPVIIAGSEERYMAIAVDDVAEALELVIRSLGVQFAQVPGVAGGATTADGQAIVALDLNALVRSVAVSELSAVPVEREKSERMLVLVVDDSRTQRMVATSQFDTLGVETVTAENGMVAIDLLNTTHRLPDVILLDVEMPVKDGIQTLREIRRSVRYKHLPVIMVTSRTGPKHRALAQEAGCNGYMGKPFNFPVLVEQIAQLTGRDLQIN